MEGKKLIEYVGKVKDLEAAIFANQQTLKRFDERAETAFKKPKRPEPPKLHSTDKPEAPELSIKLDGLDILFLLMFFVPIPLIIWTIVADLGWGFAVGLAPCSLFGLFCEIWIGEIVPAIKKYTYEKKTYTTRLDKYHQNLEKTKKLNQQMQDNYQIAVKAYDESIRRFEKDRMESRILLRRTEEKLESALQTMYSTGVIFPKYQNFVAVSTIYEYLSSGRCTTLEGADGAYNLYETELRQNIIIGHLSSISSDLKRIQKNQYTLYQEITAANQKTESLLRDILDTSRVTAYYAKATAEAAEVIRFATMVSAMK